MANICCRILHTINSSEAACYLFFGQPHSSLRNPSISMVKFEEFAHWTQEYLGFDIDTRRMKIIFPSIKRKTLFRLLLTDWSSGARQPPRIVAIVLGHIRQIVNIMPFGTYISIRLQLNLSDYVRSEYRRLPASMHARTKAQSIWSKRKFMIVNNDTALDIRLLTEALQSLHLTSLWERHLGLCVPRDPHATLLSDASYEGLGGYSLYLNFAWRLSSHDLNSMKITNRLLQYVPRSFSTSVTNDSSMTLLSSNIAIRRAKDNLFLCI